MKFTTEADNERSAHIALAATAKSDEERKEAEKTKLQVISALKSKGTTSPRTMQRVIDSLEVLAKKYSSVITDKENRNSIFQMINNNQIDYLASSLEQAILKTTKRPVNEHLNEIKTQKKFVSFVKSALFEGISQEK